jgi:hypothetical protein
LPELPQIDLQNSSSSQSFALEYVWTDPVATGAFQSSRLVHCVAFATTPIALMNNIEFGIEEIQGSIGWLTEAQECT